MRRPVTCVVVGAALLSPLLVGCTAVTVASTAVSVTASAVGLAADAAVGTVKVVGKGVAVAANALSSDGNAAPDHSGIEIRESIRPAPTAD